MATAPDRSPARMFLLPSPAPPAASGTELPRVWAQAPYVNTGLTTVEIGAVAGCGMLSDGVGKPCCVTAAPWLARYQWSVGYTGSVSLKCSCAQLWHFTGLAPRWTGAIPPRTYPSPGLIQLYCCQRMVRHH